MPKRLIITKVCFHITAVLLAIGVVITVLIIAGPMRFIAEMFSVVGRETGKAMVTPGSPPVADVFSPVAGYMYAMMIVTCVALAGLTVGVELVVRGLNRLQYWAWIVGIVICGLLILPGLHGNLVSVALGGLGLWGLLDPESVQAFKPRDNSQPTTEG